MHPEDQKTPLNCTPDFCVKPGTDDVEDIQKIELNKEAIEAFKASIKEDDHSSEDRKPNG